MLVFSNAGLIEGVFGDNNPDNYALATETYVSKDFETEAAADVWDGVGGNDVCNYDWASNYGYGGTGGWRCWPNLGPLDPDHEDNAGVIGLDGSGQIPVDSTNLQVRSFMIYVSQALLDDVFARPSGFWSSPMKAIENWQWDEPGTGPTNRHMLGFGYEDDIGAAPFEAPEAGVWFNLFVSAGGGSASRFVDRQDGQATPFNWYTDGGDQWVWVSMVLDNESATASEKWWRVYIKKPGDPGVTKIAQRRGDDETSTGTLPWGGTRGWHGGGKSMFGYWDDIGPVSVGESPTKFLVVDRIRETNGWVLPPV